MPQHNTYWQNASSSGAVFLLGIFFNALGNHFGIFFSILSNICYACLIFSWGLSIQRRILQKTIRNELLASCALLLLMLFLRAGKYYFFPHNERAMRYIWYCYYIPIIYAPLLSFCVSSHMKAPDGQKSGALSRLLFLIAGLLFFGILTNDMHQLAFKFEINFENWDSCYTHGVLFYAVIVWCVGLTLSAIKKIMEYSRVVECRRLTWVPIVLFFAGYLATEASFLNFFETFQVPELLCMTFVITWEGCIRTGLLLSNRNYETFFMHSGMASRIIDAQGRVWYEAQAEARQEKRRDSRAPIAGGCIAWEEDLTEIYRLNAQLREAQEHLDEQTILISDENKMKETRAKMEERRRLYDQMRRFALPTLEKINCELNDLSPEDPDFRRKMMRICVRATYVKRRSNIMLLSDRQPELSCDELLFSLQESLEYLSLNGRNSALTGRGEGAMRGDMLLLAYDFFEEMLEDMSFDDIMLTAHLQCDAQGMTLRIVTDDAYLPAPIWNERFSKKNGSIKSETRDDVCYTTLCFQKELSA